MASVTRVLPTTFSDRKIQKQQSLKSNSVAQLQANDSKLLENFMSLMGKSNRAVISFGYVPTTHGIKNQNFVPAIPMEESVVSTPGGIEVKAFKPTLSDYCKGKISSEASKRINGSNPWPKIDNIKAWMVTAETQEFKSDGGLGVVAADLPNSFNKKFKDDKNNEMFVVTPMYVNGTTHKLEEDNGKDFYRYGKNGERHKPVKLLGKVNVPMYFGAPHNTRLENIDVRVFTGNMNSDKADTKPTNYIFLEIPEKGSDVNNKGTTYNQFFNILDKDQKHTNNNTPYANTEFADPVYRMAFFSKVVYELMKKIKEGEFKDLESPNAVLLNDWHAGSLAAMMHYTANAEADTGIISKETGKYFDETPTLYIAHNCEHQGATDGNDWNRTNIFGTLFGAFGGEILPNSNSWNEAFKEDKSALMRYANFNSSKTGMSLADRVVPVSEYYAEELVNSNEKARGLMELMKARHYGHGHTLTPITNGYSKSVIEPTQEHMDSLLAGVKKDAPEIDVTNLKLKAYDSNSIDVKIQNKNTIMNVFKQLIERERNLPYDEDTKPTRRYMIFEADKTEIKETDFTHTPVIAYSGRVDPQKGLDSVFKESMWKFAENNKNTRAENLPVFIIGGAISQKGCYDELKNFKHCITEYYPEVGKRIILIHDFLNTHLVATAADLFLVPSVFEPCGLTQLEAMAKGALPVATSTGGLVNTIEDGVDGFRTKVFFDETGDKKKLYGANEPFRDNAEAYLEALERGLGRYHNEQGKFVEMQKRALQNDFSWDREDGPLEKYINLIKTGKTA